MERAGYLEIHEEKDFLGISETRGQDISGNRRRE